MGNKQAGILSLCKRAGKLVLGFDVVKESVQKGNAQLVLFARDVSPKTAQDLCFYAKGAGVRCMKVEYSMDELWYLVGKRAGVAAITDRGLAGKLMGETIEEEFYL